MSSSTALHHHSPARNPDPLTQRLGNVAPPHSPVKPLRPSGSHQTLTPGDLSFTDDGTPYAPAYGDVYHAQAGAWAQAQHVFLLGNDLPRRWAKRARFVILETGFGLGNNFLATWAAWRTDPKRCERLIFLSVEKHPLSHHDLRQALANTPSPELTQALLEHWPPLTPGLHLLTFDEGQVQLMLALGDAQRWLSQWVAEVDAFFLDGFAPSVNPDMWDAHLLKRLGRLAAPEATAATWSIARSVRDGLTAAGFTIERRCGFAGKRDMLVARYAPHYRPSAPPAGLRTPLGPRHAVIIGAGLAGCAAARALGLQGWDCLVLGQDAQCADGASGNAAGLFHGTFQVDDGPHARWHRAGALHMSRWARPLIREGRLSGCVDGLLRLDDSLSDAEAQSQWVKMGLPPTYLQWWPQAQAQARWGVAVPCGGWFLPDAGWLSPAEVCRLWLAQSRAAFVANVTVSAIQALPTGAWSVTATDGRTWHSPVVVVAAAQTSAALLQSPLGQPDLSWLSAVRGQTTLLPHTALPPQAARPPLPMAGAGYALTMPDGAVLCGATSQRDDIDPTVREADHCHNLQQYVRITGTSFAPADVDLHLLTGRTGWRALTRDRLPAIGPLPRPSSYTASLPLHRRERWVSPQGGLYALTGLASRGLSTALLSGELLASWISGSPCPVERDLRDAVDIARCAQGQGK